MQTLIQAASSHLLNSMAQPVWRSFYYYGARLARKAPSIGLPMKLKVVVTGNPTIPRQIRTRILKPVGRDGQLFGVVPLLLLLISPSMLMWMLTPSLSHAGASYACKESCAPNEPNCLVWNETCWDDITISSNQVDPSGFKTLELPAEDAVTLSGATNGEINTVQGNPDTEAGLCQGCAASTANRPFELLKVKIIGEDKRTSARTGLATDDLSFMYAARRVDTLKQTEKGSELYAATFTYIFDWQQMIGSAHAFYNDGKLLANFDEQSFFSETNLLDHDGPVVAFLWVRTKCPDKYPGLDKAHIRLAKPIEPFIADGYKQQFKPNPKPAVVRSLSDRQISRLFSPQKSFNSVALAAYHRDMKRFPNFARLSLGDLKFKNQIIGESPSKINDNVIGHDLDTNGWASGALLRTSESLQLSPAKVNNDLVGFAVHKAADLNNPINYAARIDDEDIRMIQSMMRKQPGVLSPRAVDHLSSYMADPPYSFDPTQPLECQPPTEPIVIRYGGATPANP